MLYFGQVAEFSRDSVNCAQQDEMSEADASRCDSPATRELLDAIRGHRRRIVFAEEGTDELRLLRYFKANANVGGPDLTHIILLPDARKVEALEEFLHGTQHRIGLIEREGRLFAEIHVKRFMIRHWRLLGLIQSDVDALKKMLGPYL